MPLQLPLLLSLLLRMRRPSSSSQYRSDNCVVVCGAVPFAFLYVSVDARVDCLHSVRSKSKINDTRVFKTEVTTHRASKKRFVSASVRPQTQRRVPLGVASSSAVSLRLPPQCYLCLADRVYRRSRTLSECGTEYTQAIECERPCRVSVNRQTQYRVPMRGRSAVSCVSADDGTHT